MGIISEWRQLRSCLLDSLQTLRTHGVQMEGDRALGAAVRPSLAAPSQAGLDGAEGTAAGLRRPRAGHFLPSSWPRASSPCLSSKALTRQHECVPRSPAPLGAPDAGTASRSHRPLGRRPLRPSRAPSPA